MLLSLSRGRKMSSLSKAIGIIEILNLLYGPVTYAPKA
jgi:hypothetical protein